METISVSIPPPLPPKTRKKSWCGGAAGGPSPVQPLLLRPALGPARCFPEGGRAGQTEQPVQRVQPPGPPLDLSPSRQSGRVHVVSIRIEPDASRGPDALSARSRVATAPVDGCVRISVGGPTATPPSMVVVSRSAAAPPPATTTPAAVAAAAMTAMATTTTTPTMRPSPDAAFLFYNGAVTTTSGQASPVDSGTCSDDAEGVATPPPLPRKTVSPSARLASRGAAAVASSAPATTACVRVTVNGDASNGSDAEDERCSTMSCDSLNSLDKVACFLDDHRNRHNLLHHQHDHHSQIDEAAVQEVVRDVQNKLAVSSPTSSSPDTSLESASGVRAVVDEVDEVHDEVEVQQVATPTAAVVVQRSKPMAIDERTYEERGVRSGSGSGSSSSSAVAPPDDRHYYDFHLNEKEETAGGEDEDTFAGHRDYSLRDEPVAVPATIRSAKGTVRGVRNRVRAGVATFLSIQHNPDAETIERLNESGELRKMLKPYKSADVCSTCEVCGGFRLLPCAVCNGSKKSVHRNHFTAELVALRCMNCDEVGLVKCYAC